MALQICWFWLFEPVKSGGYIEKKKRFVAMRECWSYSYNLLNTRSHHSSLHVVYSLKLTSEQDSQTLFVSNVIIHCFRWNLIIWLTIGYYLGPDLYNYETWIWSIRFKFPLYWLWIHDEVTSSQQMEWFCWLYGTPDRARIKLTFSVVLR